MRLLPALALGLALIAQPAGATPKEEDKPNKQEAKAERKAPEPQPQPQPQPEPEPAQSKGQGRDAPAKAKPARRNTPTPTPAPTASPSLTTVPASHVPATPAATAAPIRAAAVPAPTAAPVSPHRAPARRERPRRSARPRHAVLGFTAVAPRAVRSSITIRPLTVAAPPVAGRSRVAPRPPARGPVAATASQPADAVTRVISVVPAPLRVALGGLLALVALLTLRARRLERQRDHLSDDLGLLQTALLPALPERIGHAWISAAHRPAQGLAAGGDFYDAFALDAHRTCLLVGDVAGHARDAVPLTADVRFTLRAYLEAGLAPRAALRATAGVIEPRLEGRFVTVVVAVLDARTGLLTYAAAGHPPPLLAGTEERLVTVASSPAIGSGLPTGMRQTTLALPPGATACFYTDGLVDAKAGDDRIGAAAISAHLAALGPRAEAAELLERVVRGSEEQPDDMVACLLRAPLGPGVPRRDRVEELELDRPDAHGRALRFLRACDVPVAEAEQALEAAHDLLPVVLEVRCGATGGSVAVHRPEVAALA